MAKVKTYKEIVRFYDGVALFTAPFSIAGSPFEASVFPYLMIDGDRFAFRRTEEGEEIWPHEYEEYCHWANEKLMQRGKTGIYVVFHKKMLRLFRADVVDRCPVI